MAVLTISDTHLSLCANKPMDVFGINWENHIEALKAGWCEAVAAADTVVIPGDVSWGMTPAEALEDLKFLDGLPGKKILMRGNHDYWWQTTSKLSTFFESNGLCTLSLLNNGAMCVEDIVICGGKGYLADSSVSDAQNQKLLSREYERLKLSLKAAKRLGADEPVVFLHYPPLLKGTTPGAMVELMAENGVCKCFYGHLHGPGQRAAFQGYCRGIDFQLVSADFLNFKPISVK